MMLRIGEFSCRGRVSVKALHHYEAVGLLTPDHVGAATGYRCCVAAQLDDLHRLMMLRARRGAPGRARLWRHRFAV